MNRNRLARLLGATSVALGLLTITLGFAAGQGLIIGGVPPVVLGLLALFLAR